MAVIEGMDGLQVTILVDEVALEEINGQSFAKKKRQTHIIKYIEAKPGSPFEIKVERDHNFTTTSHHIAHEISIDKFIEFELQQHPEDEVQDMRPASPPQESPAAVYDDHMRRPFAVFEFRYRTMGEHHETTDL
ncbi:hypothetical protein B0H67DRAFT_640290 [Lasiosphaeris hirsuta]|uniref:DUF7918 domain-containing protein n=1 Tax=Lasiosphaeris hirsuta TaxID=260670 RepID=A0AA40BCX4_9PEZI|nr:hypothetical protein B0H67DRAFT_640290 [Lasiosphaeris hirsuta]